MNPLLRFHCLVLSVTAVTIFYFWKLLFSLVITNSNWVIFITVVTTIGFYRFFTVLFSKVIMNIPVLKKWIFGASYLEVVWADFFIGKEGRIRYYIETFEQDFESIRIRGKGLRESAGYYGSWISNNLNFDVRKGVLVYTYEADALNNTFINPGLASFVVERKKINSVSFRRQGFSVDLYNSKKLKSCKEKISDRPDIGNIKKVLKLAQQLYAEHKYFLTIENVKEYPPKIKI